MGWDHTFYIVLQSKYPIIRDALIKRYGECKPDETTPFNQMTP